MLLPLNICTGRIWNRILCIMGSFLLLYLNIKVRFSRSQEGCILIKSNVSANLNLSLTKDIYTVDF